jgi:hypothetical protein
MGVQHDAGVLTWWRCMVSHTLTKERSVAVLCLWVKALHERAQVEESEASHRAAPSVWKTQVRAHKAVCVMRRSRFRA